MKTETKLIQTHGRWTAGEKFFFDRQRYQFTGKEPHPTVEGDYTLHAVRLTDNKAVTFHESREWYKD